MITKNKIPILEFDDEQEGMISHKSEPPGVEHGLRLPEKAVFVFLGDKVEKYAEEQGFKFVAPFETIDKTCKIYVAELNGEKICVSQAPSGSARAVQMLDWLIGHGVKKIISTGSCGVLDDIPENDLIIPTLALRDEGTSYHYLSAGRWVEIDKEALKCIEQTLVSLNLPYVKCKTWTTDGFFRETRGMVDYRRKEGCKVVEMECSALASCAQFRGVEFGQILFTADSLANNDYNVRGFGQDSHEIAIELCFEVIKNM